jgi:hypothetical protein
MSDKETETGVECNVKHARGAYMKVVAREREAVAVA